MADEQSGERGQSIYDEVTLRGYDPNETPTEVHRAGPDAGPAEPRGGESHAPESPAAFRLAVLDAGLVEPAAFDELARGVGDVTELARVLVRAGALTAYQAGAVVQGKSKGLVIGRYVIRDRLGAGGMGVVLKARGRGDDSDVALKLLPPSFNRDPDAVARFRREVEVASRLQDPNIVSALDADEDRGMQFMVMAYVEGRDLERLVRERGPRPVGQALDAVIQAARGLVAAHAAGIVHRDIKPSNLMLDGAGVVRVLDLGLARIVDGATPFGQQSGKALTQSGSYMGTVDYMPPEQADDSHRVDHRADIYSLGCTLFFLLTGRPPFEGVSVLKRLMAHQETPAPSLRSARAAVPEALNEVYLAMMAKRPADRPATMAEVVTPARSLPRPGRGGERAARAQGLRRGLAEERRRPSRDVLVRLRQAEAPERPARRPQRHLRRGLFRRPTGGTSRAGRDLVCPKRAFRGREAVEAGQVRPWGPRPSPDGPPLCLLMLLGGLGVSEATGVTNVRGTVIRLFSPGGHVGRRSR